MNTVPSIDITAAKKLKAFLNGPDRSPESLTYFESVGFLFAVACAPELVPPSEWVPVIIDPDNAPKASLEDMQAIMGGLMSLYNEMNRQVQEAKVELPPGCSFLEDPEANLEPEASVCQWAFGFRTGYLWLEDMWSEYISPDLREEFGYHLTVLTFFSAPDTARAFHREVQNKEVTFESMAINMKRIFPDAMQGFALLGHSIQQVINKRGEGVQQPVVRGEKIGRNDPCGCGSGKKYKKCCGRILH